MRRSPKPSLALLALAATCAVGCGVNAPPQLSPIDDRVAYVGSQLEIELSSYDPEGDRVTYGFELAERSGASTLSRASVASSAGAAVFSWTPQHGDEGDHRVNFIVSDGRSVNRRAVLISVLGSPSMASRPRFVQPLGDSLNVDLAEGPCVDLDVEVDDDDSANVALRQSPAISGSTLTRLPGAAGARARFHWCPDAAQQRKPLHLLRLVADDGEHAPVLKEYQLLITPRQPVPPSGPTQGGGAGAGGLRVAPFRLDFESDDGGLSGSRDWAWGRPSFSNTDGCSTSATPPPGAHSGERVWATVLDGCYSPLGNNQGPTSSSQCENKSASDDSVLKLSFEIPAGKAGAYLTFYEWRDVYAPYDYAEVRVGGKLARQFCEDSYEQPTRWVKRYVSLSAYVGKRVDLSFHLAASTVINYSGWYIDDLEISVY